MPPRELFDLNVVYSPSFYESYCEMLERDFGWWVNQIHEDSERPIAGFDDEDSDTDSEIILDGPVIYDSDLDDDDSDTLPMLGSDDQFGIGLDESGYRMYDIIDLTMDSDDETVDDN